MPQLSVNNIQMYYELHGQGEPLVLIAGLSVDHLVWVPVLDELARHYQVLIFDNRGAGRTDSPEQEYTLETMAEDTMALCQALNLSKPHILGSSMGGGIAQTIAYHYPDQINKVVICNSFPELTQQFRLVLDLRLDLFEKGATSEQLLRLTLPWAFSDKFLTQPQMVPALLELGLNNPYPQNLAGFKQQKQALYQFDSRSWLPEIKVPTLLLAADKDIISPPQQSKEIAALIPGASYVCLEEVGHVSHIEVPQKFNQIVMDFLRN